MLLSILSLSTMKISLWIKTLSFLMYLDMYFFHHLLLLFIPLISALHHLLNLFLSPIWHLINPQNLLWNPLFFAIKTFTKHLYILQISYEYLFSDIILLLSFVVSTIIRYEWLKHLIMFLPIFLERFQSIFVYKYRGAENQQRESEDGERWF